MTAVIVALFGLYTVHVIREAGIVHARSGEASLADSRSLQSVVAAFAALRSTIDRRQAAADPDLRARIDQEIDAHRLTLDGALDDIAGRSTSIRVQQTVEKVREATKTWLDGATAFRIDGEDTPAPANLDRGELIAEKQIALLQRGTEASGAAELLRGREQIDREATAIVVVAGSALLLTALAAWLSCRRLQRAGPMPAAHEDCTATRDAPSRTPLAPAFSTEAWPRSTGRLGEAFLSSATGVIVIDADASVVSINREARSLLGYDIALPPGGLPLPDFAVATRVPSALFEALDPTSGADARTEVARADGVWLRIHRVATTDHGALALVHDVSAQKAHEMRLRATSAGLQTAVDNMSQGLCLYDGTHHLLVVNRTYSELYRLPPGAVHRGMSATDVLDQCVRAGNHPGRSVADLIEDIGRAFGPDEHGPFFQELGDGRVLAITKRPTDDGGCVATYEDVTERWHAEAQIAYMARHDTLTDLPNRVLFGERIASAITQAGRESGFAVHCLDLDHFKQVNDTLGHAVGDELLRAVAYRLSSCVREIDTVARLGGDEFAVVQAAIEHPQDATVLAERIIDILSAPYELTDHAVTIGVSIGIAVAPSDGMAADKLLKNADVALYRAKADGRGVYRFFEAQMDARLQARRIMEIDLRAAAAAEAFELFYQPIYDLRRDRICGFEALLRWNHPTRGPISPAEFIPVAEEIGLIVPLGEWVLKRACAEASSWPSDLKVAINVSPTQCQSTRLVETVQDALAASRLAPQRLELEITESVLLTSGAGTLALLHALRSSGVRISMDDFGTGYSSLSYLRSFPFDKMKIDKSFIRDLCVENGSGFIVRAVISLGSSLGMTMTAEGVETEAQLNRLREEACDEIQGYFISAPVPAAVVPQLIKKWNGASRAVA